MRGKQELLDLAVRSPVKAGFEANPLLEKDPKHGNLHPTPFIGRFYLKPGRFPQFLEAFGIGLKPFAVM